MATDSVEQKVHLAVFGKHPGWDDHIEEIGLDIPELVTARRLLYSEGVAGNIDSGAWDRLDEGKLLPAFKHNFFWRIGGQWIVGRMWSSRDGKGRSKYPMVVCGRIDGASASFAARHIVPSLIRFEEAVKATTRADDVKQAATQARLELVRAASNERVGEGSDSELLRRLVDHPNLMPGGDTAVAFERVMYEIEREMQGFRRQSGISRAKQEPAGQHIRVPRCFDEPGEGARAWTALLDRNIDPSSGVLVIEPDDADFVDVLVGAPAVGHIFCLRANREALGLTTEVPYTIDPEFAAIARARRESYRKHSTHAESAGVQAGLRNGSRGSSNVKWFILAGIGLVGVIVGALALSGGGGSTSDSNTPDPVPEKKQQPKSEPAPKPAPLTTTQPASTPAEVPAQSVAAKPTDTAMPKPAPSKAPRSFDPSDPRAAWRSPTRIAELEARFESRAPIHGIDAPREASSMRDVLRDAREILDEALALEYPQGRITIEFTMKKLDERVAELERASETVDRKVIESAKAAAVVPRLSTPALVDAWRAWFATLDFSQGSAIIRERAALASAACEGADRDLSRVLGSESANLGVDTDPLRADATTSVAQSASRGDFESARARSSEFAGRIDSLEVLGRDAAALHALLDAGFLPDERTKSGDSVEGLVRKIRATAAFSIVPGAFGETLRRADELLAVRDLVEMNQLVERLDRPGSQALAAMMRLSANDIRISGSQLLEASRAYSGAVAESLKLIPEETRRARVEAEVKAAASACWLNASESLGGDEEGLAALESSAKGFGIEVWSSASARVRFNRALRALRVAESESIGEAAMELLERGEALAPSQRELVRPLIDALKSLKPVRKKVDFSQIGPATAGWKLVESDDSRAVYEKGMRGGAPVRMEFRAITTPSGGKSMVLATEVSVRMASVMVQDANALTSKTAAMVGWRFSGESTDSRAGPRTWTWAGVEPTLELIPVNASGPGQGWIRGAEAWVGSSIAQSNPKPSWDSPMQYIGVSGALLLSRAAGCHLPTVEEFGSVAQSVQSGGVSNLRDASWAAVAGAWIAVNQASTSTCPVNADSFSSSFTGGSTPSLARTDSDGVVWFDRVDSGSGEFRNVTGNVAEYVVASAKEMQVLANTQVESLLRLRDVPAVIIGASALSGPEVKAAEGVKMNPLSARGYSDVGFRLAFGLGVAEGPMEWDSVAIRGVAAEGTYVKRESGD